MSDPTQRAVLGVNNTSLSNPYDMTHGKLHHVVSVIFRHTVLGILQRKYEFLSIQCIGLKFFSVCQSVSQSVCLLTDRLSNDYVDPQ